jgi:hypothetical protein
MKYWFDTEFIDDGKTIDLISIGIVAEDGRTYYAESQECDLGCASEWVKQNVIPHLTGETKPRQQIADEIADFIKPNDCIEIWAYYGAYDWVAFCQLYGRMLDIPQHIPMFFNDVKSLCVSVGSPSLPVNDGIKHNALDDAIWTKEAWEFLNENHIAASSKKVLK